MGLWVPVLKISIRKAKSFPFCLQINSPLKAQKMQHAISTASHKN